DAATGLASPDVFYYGSAIGETGDNSGNTFVNAGDFIGVRDHPSNFPDHAPPSNPYDFNHDSFVNATDLIITRDNGNNFQTAIKLISPAAPAPAAMLSTSAASVPAAGANLAKSSAASSAQLGAPAFIFP